MTHPLGREDAATHGGIFVDGNLVYRQEPGEPYQPIFEQIHQINRIYGPGRADYMAICIDHPGSAAVTCDQHPPYRRPYNNPTQEPDMRRIPGRHRNTNDLWSASPREWLRDGFAVLWRNLTGTPAPRTVNATATIPGPTGQKD